MITISTAKDMELVRTILHAYAESGGLDVSIQKFEEELATLEQFYEGIFLASLGERVAGCVALRRVDDQTCEMKRLFVRPPMRKKGAGSALVQCVIEEARQRGFTRMRIGILPRMTDAARLCEAVGFRDAEITSTATVAAGARFLELQLASDSFPADMVFGEMDLEDVVESEDADASESTS